MAKKTVTDTRVERGVGSFENQWFGYAKRDVRHDPDDLYEYRYDEVGPFDTEEEAAAAAEKAHAAISKKHGDVAPDAPNAAYEEGGAGHRLRALRAEIGIDEKRLIDTGEVR